MGVRLLSVVLCAGMFILTVFPMQSTGAQDAWWDSAWSSRQEIVLPIKTTMNFSVYQPVDTTVVFSNPCWTENETRSSVRVICQWKDHTTELESQIYDLVQSDPEHIASCNLVFLIPPDADGTERYYVYYNNIQTAPAEYPDHVAIAESSYFYEPIPGYPLQSHFYEIIQNGSVIYAIAQDGTYLYYSTAQFVTRLAVGVTEMNLANAQTATSFEFAYYYGNEMWQYNSTSQQLVSKDVLCDGNLMVSCRIVSRSTAGDLQTTAVYKYFYSPTNATRIHAHVVHEALKDCHVYPGTNTDGTYAGMQCGRIQSQSIPALNFGKLYPFLHVYTEQNQVEEVRVDLNPEYNSENPVLRLLQTTDDVDLGAKAWASYDDGPTGTVHAVVFASTSVVKAGVDERDGVQVKAYESDYPHLPGLVYTIAGFQFTRNAYERNASGKDTVIPKGFTAEFDAEFFSSPAGGYPLAAQEANVFQALATILPEPTGMAPSGNVSSQLYGLTVDVHGAPSLPFGSALAALTGRSYPYITAEVWRDELIVSSGTAARIPFRQISTPLNASFRERFVAAVRMVDLRNISLRKKMSFQGLEPGRYVVKVFRENPRVGNDRRFIGYTLVDLTADSTVRIRCHLQGSCRVSLVDQQGAGVSGAVVQLLSGGMILAQNTTDSAGAAMLDAPCGVLNRYTLRVMYNGFMVENESIKLRFGQAIFPLRVSLELVRYGWMVSLVDLWGLPLGVDVSPRLRSPESSIELAGQQSSNDSFVFSDLIPARYTLQVSYKSFQVEQEVVIPAENEVVVFPAQFPVSFRVLDSHGGEIGGVMIRLTRGGKTSDVGYNGSGSSMMVPPGVYQLNVLNKGDTVIGQRMVDVVGYRSLELITTQEPVFPWIVLLVSVLLIVCGLGLSILKKDLVYVLVFLVVGVGLASLVVPWWSLQGSSGGVQTSSVLYLVPLDLVSMTTTSQVIAGELAYFPAVFITVMTVVVGLMVLGWCCLGGSMVVKKVARRRWFLVALAGGLGLLVVSLVLFSVGMSAFTEVGVGSFLGQGTVDVVVQGQEGVVQVPCQWGPGAGFWLCVVSIVLLGCTLVVIVLKKSKEKK